MINKKIITPLNLIIVIIISIVVSASATYFVVGNSNNMQSAGKPSNNRVTQNDFLYQEAINDAIIADEDEVLPIIEITKDSDDVIWNESGDKVLLLNFNKYPDSYPDGENVEIQWGYVWTSSAKEFLDWYSEDNNSQEVDDWSLRIKQLLGMDESSENTHMTAMWVDPTDLIRPAYVTDITKQMKSDFDSEKPESEEYTAWFNENAVYSYCENTYPWTRLGYTYDWADNGVEYGLSEFLINDRAIVEVEFTKTIDDFIKWVEANKRQ